MNAKKFLSNFSRSATIGAVSDSLNDLTAQLEQGRGRVRFALELYTPSGLLTSALVNWFKAAILIMEPGAKIGIMGGPEGTPGSSDYCHHVDLSIDQLTGNEADALTAWAINQYQRLGGLGTFSIGWRWEDEQKS